ncbi:MAG: hypothetical protein WC998_02920 [Candidatus Paceibacterota bacterium]|jgi:hypothetical protein
MTTPEEIQEAAAQRAINGVAERQIADRRTRYINPKDALEASELLGSIQSTTGPFVRVGLKSREF